MSNGTSGARQGYKIFSFSTTIRNPKRNIDFLRVFEKYDGQLMDDLNLYNYFFQLVQEGIYKFSNIPESIKTKLELNESLTLDEVASLIQDNPQATGLNGRVMTQLRALKDQGFLIFKKGSKRKYIISLTKLGNELIDNVTDGTIVYTKAMIGAHAKNPARTSMLNESVPFLNTVFVINEVNKLWSNLGNDPKGVLLHEFGAFILSMKDCDYKKIANEIIKYRKENRYKINKTRIKRYLKENEILDFKFDSIVKDYPDEVFRKFEMTGLLVQRGRFNYRYIDFSKVNIDKINTILEYYNNYVFLSFANQEEYYNYLSSITIPWEKDEILRKQIVQTKYKILGLTYSDEKSLIEQEEYVDILLRKQALTKAINEYDIEIIKKEMKILSGTINTKSRFDDLAEPLRLEYLLALLLGKVYGTTGLVSNIIYGEDGKPLHYAPAGKSDIVLYTEQGSYIFEPTMQRNRSQLLNNETTNIVRHAKQLKIKTKVDYRVMMVAPYVHIDVAEYFKYNVISQEALIIPSTIEKTTGMIIENETIPLLNESFDNEITNIKTMDISDFIDMINVYRL